MDNPVGFCSFLFHSRFVHFLEICHLFDFHVTEFIYSGHHSIKFYDSLHFLIFLALVANENNVSWSFL